MPKSRSSSAGRRRQLRLDSLESRAVPAVTTSFDVVTHRLIVRSDSDDAIVVGAAGPAAGQLVTVNGKPTAVLTPAAMIQTLDVRGGPGANRINLAGVRATVFASLTAVRADGGAGHDRITGSPLADDLLGGPGDDRLWGLGGNDTLRGGGGLDVLDGGAGDDRLQSSDPVEAGFNDAAGLNADATADSPYQIGGILFGKGQGEPGWATGWQHPQGPQGNATVQSGVVFEGDGALRLAGGTTGIYRDWSAGVTAGKVTVSQMIYVPAGGGILQYLQDGALGGPDLATAAQWSASASGNFQVLDSGIGEDTGIPVPVQQWVRVDIVVDMTARTYDFYVDGIKYAAPDPLGFRGNPGALNRVTFLLENVPGIYVDALQVDGTDAPTTAPRGDTLRGGPGADTLRGGSGPDLLDGGADNDSLSGGTGNDTLRGGAAHDDLSGDDGRDLLMGQGGSDTGSGGAGDDTLLGGADADSLTGGRGNDSLNGGSGNDILDGEADGDTATGGTGDDTVDGGSGNDRLAGAGGNDLLRGGGGGDDLDGGGGNDRVESADPPPPPGVPAGFNDAQGVNADPTPDSPYTLGGALHGSGGAEPGWVGGWYQSTGSAGLATIQTANVFEGDGALAVAGGTAGFHRVLTTGEATGVLTVSQMIYVPAGGGFGQYVMDSGIADTAAKTAAQWNAYAGGTFSVLDSGVWENTGIVVPVEQWTKVDVRVDMAARSYDFFVNGTRYVPPDPVGFRGNPGVVDLISFLVDTGPGIVLDDIRMIGPDPAGDPATFGDTLTGGAGNDTVVGGRGTDLLKGGAGRDALDGGDGGDMLVGGADADQLQGGPGEDLLIGGTTVFDRHPLGLPAILAEWTSTRDVATRMANVQGTGTGPRLNGVYVLNRGAVRFDGKPDQLTGGDDSDWFFARPGEDTTDAAGEDFVTGL